MKNSKALKMTSNVLKALMLPLLVFVVFAILTGGRTVSLRMFMTTLRQSVVPALICWGIMLKLTVGMMDFSAGAVVIMSAIVGGNLSQMTGNGILGMALFAILTGLLTGVLTGVLHIKMRVPCMVLTIGLMLAFEAFPRTIFSKGISIPASMTVLALSPWCFIILGVMLLVFYIIYNFTPFGHNLRAIGSNQAISDSVGLNSDKSKFLTFLLGGLFLGVAATLHLSASGEIRPGGAMSSMLVMMDGFMGMFLSMFISNYCNLAFAVPISVVTMKMISNGFVALGMSSTVRDITNGGFCWFCSPSLPIRDCLHASRRTGHSQNRQMPNTKHRKSSALENRTADMRKRRFPNTSKAVLALFICISSTARACRLWLPP